MWGLCPWSAHGAWVSCGVTPCVGGAERSRSSRYPGRRASSRATCRGPAGARVCGAIGWVRAGSRCGPDQVTSNCHVRTGVPVPRRPVTYTPPRNTRRRPPHRVTSRHRVTGVTVPPARHPHPTNAPRTASRNERRTTPHQAQTGTPSTPARPLPSAPRVPARSAPHPSPHSTASPHPTPTHHPTTQASRSPRQAPITASLPTRTHTPTPHPHKHSARPEPAALPPTQGVTPHHRRTAQPRLTPTRGTAVGPASRTAPPLTREAQPPTGVPDPSHPHGVGTAPALVPVPAQPQVPHPYSQRHRHRPGDSDRRTAHRPHHPTAPAPPDTAPAPAHPTAPAHPHPPPFGTASPHPTAPSRPPDPLLPIPPPPHQGEPCS